MQPVLPQGYELASFEEIDSTNEEARRRAQAGERGPLWIWALRQTAGRGRRGRAWESPTGNLSCTLLLAPGVAAADAARLSFVAALAVRDAVSHFLAGATVQVKWPNDVLIDGNKVAGILLESSGDSGSKTLPWLAVGIGVNLARSPEASAFPATSISAHATAPTPSEALTQLAAAWDRHFRTWRANGFAPIRKAWLEYAAGIGQTVTARLPGETVNGTFSGLDQDGALLLALPDGSNRAITAGEVFFAAP
ncbi:MAG: biotin--[acetyl-CoA-carboxylase] ligase [Alphaproteobacteria bacterium]|nr:biotin--[acetyl-CoA-carboxylase] ligase [Alphaproteobacteria bacterium]